jgi:hypothetical protein
MRELRAAGLTRIGRLDLLFAQGIVIGCEIERGI